VIYDESVPDYVALRSRRQYFSWHILQFLGTFVKLPKATVSFVMSVYPSVRPHDTTGLPVDEFSLNLIFEYLSKICRENSTLIKI
jgi:hypothetical protein